MANCASADLFDVAATDPDDPSCAGFDVSALWGLPDTKLVGCCRADGTCGGTTASLPKLAQSVFGATPACLSAQEFNDAFAKAPVPWTIPVASPVLCGTTSGDP